MLYLAAYAEPASLTDFSFEAPLSQTGQSQAQQCATLFQGLDIKMVYTAPSRRALDTVSPFLDACFFRNRPIRTEIQYALYHHAATGAALPKQLSLDHLRQLHCWPQHVYMTNDTAVESFPQYQQRVVEWFSNICMPRLEESPVETLIVTDPATVQLIAAYIGRRNKGFALPCMRPAAVHSFRGDGMYLVYSGQIQ